MVSAFSATVFLCLAVSVANVFANHGNLCDNFDCGENGMCEVKSRPRKPDQAKCKCKDGFRGRKCQVEFMISHRCYFRPNSPTELNQIAGIGECPDPVGQFCLPDNFYCTMYGCDDSIGRCIKAAVITSGQINEKQQPQKGTPTMTRRGMKFNPEPFDGDEKSQEDEFDY